MNNNNQYPLKEHWQRWYINTHKIFAHHAETKQSTPIALDIT